MIEWLLQPIDPVRVHDVGAHLSWHGRTMVLAWGALVPVGIVAARYFKVMPRQDWPRELDNRAWWHLHRAAQYSAGLLMLVGLVLVLRSPQPSASLTAGAGLHRLLGWTILALAASQFLSGWLRGSKGGPTSPAPDGTWRGDHFDMTLRRRLFEHGHKFGGLGALALSIAAIATGLWQANAPRWMWLAMACWWLLLAGITAACERRRRAIDTYQAIWGPDPTLPGNRIRPIGLRVVRPAAESFQPTAAGFSEPAAARPADDPLTICSGEGVPAPLPAPEPGRSMR